MNLYGALVCLVVAGAASVLAVATRRRARETRSPSRLASVALNLALLATVAAILAVTLAPMDPDEHHVRLVPLTDLREAFSTLDRKLLLEKVFNVLLFVPLGFVLGLRAISIGKTLLAALVLSAAIELVQALFVTGRTTSFDDFLLNVLGALLGYVLVSRSRDVPAVPR